MHVEEARDLVGTGVKVIYRPYPGAEPEEGVVTSVNPTSRLVFVRYGADITAKATRPEDLERMTATIPGASEQGGRQANA